MTVALSVMIPTYNCSGLLRQTLRSVLTQGLPSDRAEIVVVDDYSTKDDPEQVTKEVGEGRVRFERQERNVGAIRNFNTCVRLAQGEFIHILHGDDFILPGFYSAVLGHALRFPDVGLICTRSFIVDEAGGIESMSPRLRHLEVPNRDIWPLIYGGNLIQTPSVVVRRAVYNGLGSFDESLVHVADWEMWVRAIAAAGGVCVNQPLAAYRVFAGQDTARLQQRGENVRDLLRLCEIWTKVLLGFDRVRFLRIIEGVAIRQLANFSARGVIDALAPNGRALDEVRARLRQVSDPR